MKKRGYALPLSLCVAGVTLMLGLSAAQMTNGDLAMANHQYYQERARQAADFGLEYCVTHPVQPGVAIPVPSLSGAHPFDSVTVQSFRHGDAGCPVEVPQGFEYWVAEGRASERSGGTALTSARVGALVRFGLSAGTSGAQVRSLFFRSSVPVNLQAYDGVQRIPVLGQSILSSEYTGSGASFLFPGQSETIQLGEIGASGGNVRIPTGADKALVKYTNNLGFELPILQDGGPINVPTYTPPTGLAAMGVKQVASGFIGSLPSGHYDSLEIPASADVSLNGTYQFDELKLAPGVSLGQGGILRVSTGQSAKVFIDKIDLGMGSLGLTNENTSAQNFRLTLKASRPPSGAPPAPIVNFKLPDGGGVAVVADGHHLRLVSGPSREIRGAFSANAIECKFLDPSGPFPLPAVFAYDVSASTARKAASLDGGSVSNLGGNAGNSGNSGNTESSGNTDSSGGGDNSDNSPSSVTGGVTISSLARTGLEPLILSRQPL